MIAWFRGDLAERRLVNRLLSFLDFGRPVSHGVALLLLLLLLEAFEESRRLKPTFTGGHLLGSLRSPSELLLGGQGEILGPLEVGSHHLAERSGHDPLSIEDVSAFSAENELVPVGVVPEAELVAVRLERPAPVTLQCRPVQLALGPLDLKKNLLEPTVEVLV